MGRMWVVAVVAVLVGASGCGSKDDENRRRTPRKNERPPPPKPRLVGNASSGQSWTADRNPTPGGATRILVDNGTEAPVTVALTRGEHSIDIPVAAGEHAIVAVRGERGLADTIVATSPALGAWKAEIDPRSAALYVINPDARYRYAVTEVSYAVVGHAPRETAYEGLVAFRIDTPIEHLLVPIPESGTMGSSARGLDHAGERAAACPAPAGAMRSCMLSDGAPARYRVSRADAWAGAPATVLFDLTGGKPLRLAVDGEEIASVAKPAPVEVIVDAGIHELEVRGSDGAIVDHVRKRLSARKHIFNPRGVTTYRVEFKAYGASVIAGLPPLASDPYTLRGMRLFTPSVWLLFEPFPAQVEVDLVTMSADVSRLVRRGKGGAVAPATKAVNAALESLRATGKTEGLDQVVEWLDPEWADACDLHLLQRMIVAAGGKAKPRDELDRHCPAPPVNADPG